MSALGVLGGGQMARALVGGLVPLAEHGISSVILFDPNPQATAEFLKCIPAAISVAAAGDVAQQSDIVLLATKPQFACEALSTFGRHTRPRLLVSVAAGIRIESLASWGHTPRVARVMPNTPALVRKGAAAIAYSSGANAADRRWVESCLSHVGEVAIVEESMLDAVTGLSGSGPAYVLQFILALVEGGVRAGLPADISHKLALQTVAGTLELIAQTGRPLAELRSHVTSPGGTTMQGLRALSEGDFDETIANAILAATRRAAELADPR